ncbi:PREDICTED: uncharacterized protein LOC106816508 [Priapulus caudatus]|uniref:Uncharacterized protein LOC106816508 n=1 Tax=Priapulus caudatus TaxID=37621 RepID=A0ABM1EWQ0_PRICU|nr:PREDICTED: uncharacterized protein LOC106816508 [Priapulus caudatus]
MVQEQRKGDGQHTACLPNPNANLSASVTRPQGPSHDRKKKPRKRNKKKKPVIGVLKSASQQEAAPAKPLQANNVADGSTTVEPHRPSAQNPGDALSVATGRARKRKMQRKINKTRSSDAATLSLSPDADSRPGSDAADGHSGMRRGTRANARVPPIDAEGQTEVSRTERKRKRTQPDEKLPCLLAPAAAPSGSKRKKLRGRKMVRKPQANACAKRNTEERAAGKCVPDRIEPKTTAVKVEVASESAAHRKAASAKGKRQVAVEKRKLKAREYNKQMKLRTRQKHAKRRKTHEGKTELGANTDSENLQKLASEMAAVTVEVEPPSNPGDVSANWKKLLATEPKTVKNAGVKRKRNATLLNPKWNGVKTPVEGEPK